MLRHVLPPFATHKCLRPFAQLTDFAEAHDLLDNATIVELVFRSRVYNTQHSLKMSVGGLLQLTRKDVPSLKLENMHENNPLKYPPPARQEMLNACAEVTTLLYPVSVLRTGGGGRFLSFWCMSFCW